VSDFQVILLGNYAPDGQPSMVRFGDLLLRGWRRRNIPAFLLQPTPFWRAKWSGMFARAGGFADKSWRFIRRLPQEMAALPLDSRRPVIYHICDHGNAHYRRALPARGVLATCHDLLALRSERGELPFQPSRGPLASWQQRRMFAELQKIPWLACDSQATRTDFLRMAQRADESRVRVIPLTLNHAYRPLTSAEITPTLAPWPKLRQQPYVLQVGGNEPRKNRMLLPKILAEAVRNGWNGLLVLAGAPPTPAWWDAVRVEGVLERVMVVEHPTTETLNALYSGAYALIFPSFAEGFGWPVLEAQAAGCPVLCSNTTSLPEVAGDAALMFAPADASGFAGGITRLAQDASLRAELIRRGFNQVARFSEDAMFAGYEALYQAVLADA